MRRLISCVAPAIALSLLIPVQSVLPGDESLLLPDQEKVSGVVVDAAGEPIVGAEIDYTDSPRKAISTDVSGHFELSTRAPAVVIRKVGYKSAFLRTAKSVPVRITLEASHSTIAFCEAKAPCEAIGGSGTFCLPRIKGVKVSERVSDADYTEQFFSVQSKDGVKAIRHGEGPLWGFGPLTGDIWRSTEYSEEMFMVGQDVIIAGRGKTSDGKFWRFIGKFGESASYINADQNSASMLNQVLDGMCIRAK